MKKNGIAIAAAGRERLSKIDINHAFFLLKENLAKA
jgi:hypothetical protein